MKRLFLLLAGTALLAACREEEEIIPSTGTVVTPGENAGPIAGFFLLNEGNMGSNKATLDYFDYETGVYTKNIYAERNPGVVKELGDVGNDIQVYGSKLYIVVNCSHFVEVMDARTAKHITQLSIPNCRYIVFKDRHAYISSYAGPVKIDPNARLGYVARVDTADLARPAIDTCVVGYQPEEMVIVGDKLYVANSGGYRVPDYDRTVSVIDLASFKVIQTITVGINLHRLEVDNRGYIYVSSRGDYYGTPSKTYVIDSRTDKVVDELPLLPNSNMTLRGDSLYVYSTEWSYITHRWSISYAILNTLTRKVVTRSFIKDGTEKQIRVPYGIAVHPVTGEILVTDAKDYVTPGTIYCFTPDGKKKWSEVTGDIPAHVAFTREKLEPKK
ncbi:MAG: YncE family protein [Odoribacteraceae bacterium]|nr:YncE family protein [Odoribacteraceae bacterium]